MSRENNEKILGRCNALGCYGSDDAETPLMAFQFRGGKFYDPSGVVVAPPGLWRPATLAEILDYYEAEGLACVQLNDTVH